MPITYLKGPESIQGSPEWLEFRRSKIGASAGPSILGVNPYQDAADVYDQMILAKEVQDNPAMARGRELEPIAREYYNLLNNDSELTGMRPAVVLNSDYPHLMASLDGISSDKSQILEIKCPGDKVYYNCSQGNYPLYWIYQIQQQLLLSGSKVALLLVWKSYEENLTVPFYPEQSKMDELSTACLRFYEDNLLEFKRPSSLKDCWDESTDFDLIGIAEEYREVSQQITKLEKEQAALKLQLLSGLSVDRLIVGPLKVQKTVRKGTVDYTQAFIDSGITNLAPWRRESSEFWKITEA